MYFFVLLATYLFNILKMLAVILSLILLIRFNALKKRVAILEQTLAQLQLQALNSTTPFTVDTKPPLTEIPESTKITESVLNPTQPQQAVDNLAMPPVIVPHAAPQPLGRVKPQLEPDESSVPMVSSVLTALKQWFTGGNLIVRVGIIVLLVGVILLLKLASQFIHIPIEFYLGLVVLSGILLVGLGMRFAGQRRGYGLTLEGGGFAIVYLTLFWALNVYHVIPAQLTFVLLAGLAGISAWLSVRQNAFPIALLAFGGAFLAPIVANTGSHNLVGLFGYYLVLNIAVASIAHYRTWKVLNTLGALVTFGVAGFLGWQSLDTTLLHTIRWPLEGLLVAHVALYLFILVRYGQNIYQYNQAIAGKKQQNNAFTEPSTVNVQTPFKELFKPLNSLNPVAMLDGTLLFGVPLAAFGLQAGLMHGLPNMLAISSAVMAAVYIGLGFYLVKKQPHLRLMTEGTLALGVAFLALVVPLALSAQWTVIGWVIQGAGLVWLGVRQNKKWPVMFGLLLQALAWLLMNNDSLMDIVGLCRDCSRTQGSIINDGLTRSIVPVVMLMAAWLASAFFLKDYQKTARPTSIALPYAVLAVTTWVWLVGSIQLHSMLAVNPFVAPTYYAWGLLSLAAIGLMLDRAQQWPQVRQTAKVWLFMTGVVLILSMGQYSTGRSEPYFMATHHYNMIEGSLTLLAFTGLALLWYRRWFMLNTPSMRRRSAKYPVFNSRVLIFVTLLLGVGVLVDYTAYSFAPSSGLLTIAALLLALVAARRMPVWLDKDRLLQNSAYLVLPLLGWNLFWLNWHDSGSFLSPVFGLVPYFPLFNMLDTALLAVAVYALAVYPKLGPKGQKWLGIGGGIAAFWTVSSMWVRFYNVQYQTGIWSSYTWENSGVQTGLTLLWTLTALVLTVTASRLKRRTLWKVGLGLLGLVLAKLVLLDLSTIGAIARVISFIGAGLMMLFIGYIAPLPPAAQTRDLE